MPAAVSPAAKKLTGAGVRLVDVAIMARTTPASISRYLAGHCPPPDAFLIALRRLLGPEEFTEILDLIPEVERAS